MRTCEDGCNGCDECTDYADEDSGPPEFGCCLPPGEKLVVVPVRLTEAQKAKLQRIGVQRLREWLDRVREPSA